MVNTLQKELLSNVWSKILRVAISFTHIHHLKIVQTTLVHLHVLMVTFTVLPMPHAKTEHGPMSIIFQVLSSQQSFLTA